MLDLRSINQNRFEHAKHLWTIANLLRLAAFVFGAWAVFLAKPTLYLPQILFVIAMAAELFQWRSDVIKGRCESLLRKLDLCRSFDMPISSADKRDIVAYLPKSLRKRFSDSELPDTYFTSSEPSGSRKAIENLVESAWYSKQQANMMAGVCIILTVIVIGIALGALIVTSNEVQSAATRANISKVVTSWLLLVFSLGMFKHGWAYYKFAERSGHTFTTGEHLLRGQIAEADAVKQWYEYQIGRASSPLLPQWLWKLRQDALNDAWEHVSAN